jgi:surface antigen
VMADGPNCSMVAATDAVCESCLMRLSPFVLPLIASLGLAACQSSSPPQVTAVSTGPQISGVIAGAALASLSDSDRERGFKAQVDALETGKRTTWRSEKTAFGFVEPGSDGIGGCRAYSHTVYLDGRAQRAAGQGCKQADGSWSFR